jgi:O-antigen/teichoic acid export membrane protein
MAVGVVLGASLTLALVFAGYGIWALLAGVAAQLATRWVLQFWALRSLFPGIGFGISWPGLRAARNYIGLSGLVLIGQIAFVVDSQWDRIVLARFVGPASVASFAVGTIIVLGAQQLVFIALAPILPAVSELRNRDNDAMEDAYSVLSRMGAVAIALLLGGIFTLGPAFINLWLGPRFALAGVAVRLFSLACAIGMLGSAVASRAVGLRRHRIVAVAATCNIFVNGVLSYALASTIGFKGPLIGSIVGSTVNVVVLSLVLWRRYRERWVLPRFWAPLFGVAVAALTILTGLDQPTTWLRFGATALLLGIVLAVGALAAERLPVRTLLAHRSTVVGPYGESPQAP